MDSTGPLTDEGLVQLLDHHGLRHEHEVYSQYAADLTADDLRAMWRNMTVARAFDNEATSLQRQGELGLWVPALGQEGAQAGSAHALKPQDFVFPAYREHVVAHARGIEMPNLLRVFRGLEHGSWNPKDHNFHLYTLVIGSHTLHATGYAMAMDRDGKTGTGDPEKDSAVVCYFGDGATSQGDTNEALVFAAVYDAPIVFFCQNNQFAISEPTTRQSKVPLAERGKGVGMPTVRVDGNDPVASYAVTKWALEHARSGAGPVFIEAFTFRVGAHTTSDDPSRYRSKATEQYWAERDPIERLETYLTSTGELPQEFVDEVRAEGKDLAVRTRTAVRSWESPAPKTMFDNVYGYAHQTVDHERAWFDRYQRSFADAEGQA